MPYNGTFTIVYCNDPCHNAIYAYGSKSRFLLKCLETVSCHSENKHWVENSKIASFFQLFSPIWVEDRGAIKQTIYIFLEVDGANTAITKDCAIKEVADFCVYLIGKTQEKFLQWWKVCGKNFVDKHI